MGLGPSSYGRKMAELPLGRGGIDFPVPILFTLLKNQALRYMLLGLGMNM